MFGLSPEWLLADGVPIADALVLSHPEQLERLQAGCPEAKPSAFLGGDPCYDRILAARVHRERFRRALGVGPRQRLVLLNSTWNPESLFGDADGADVLPSLLPRLAAELPADEYRVAAVLHPNIWHGHGPGQVLSWLDRARRGGLALVDPLHDWRQAVIAADAAVGDFGSVSYYLAALGTPVLLGATPTAGLDPASPVAAFVRQAPALDPSAPLRPQLERLLAAHRPLDGPRELTSSVPGGSAELLRGLFYRLIGIPEPPGPALLDPLPLPEYRPPLRTVPLRVLTSSPDPGPGSDSVGVGGGPLALERYADAAPPLSAPQRDEDGLSLHTAVDEETRDPGRLALADVIVRHGTAGDPRLGTPEQWTAEILARFPHCAVAAFVTGPADCTARTAGGALFRLSGPRQSLEPAAFASALYAALARGDSPERLATDGLTVRIGFAPDAPVVTVAVTLAVTPLS